MYVFCMEFVCAYVAKLDPCCFVCRLLYGTVMLISDFTGVTRNAENFMPYVKCVELCLL